MPFGLFKKKRAESEAVIDLGKLEEIRQKTGNIPQDQNSQITNNENLGFLTNLASAAASGSDEIQALNFDKHIKNFDTKVERLLQRIELLEIKIKRLEQRSGL